jgi:hypothetical protein
MTPHSVHLHVKRLALDAAGDRAALIESIRQAVEQRLQSATGAQGGDWTQVIANTVADAVSQASPDATRSAMEGRR